MSFNDNASLDTSQVESGGGGGFGGGGGGRGPMVFGGGIGGLILTVICYFVFGGNGGGSSSPSGQNAQNQTQQQGGAGADATSSGSGGPVQDQINRCHTGADANHSDTCLIVGTVNSVQNFWQQALPQMTNGQVEYSRAKARIFSGSDESSCGPANSDTGPFYCSSDREVFIDAGFFKQLTDRFGADGGEFAKEYVVAHEYGHHVQDLLGELGAAQQDPQGADSGSVRTELQADCYAGIWAHYASQTTSSNGKPFLKPLTQNDVKSALSAAAAVGDDRIQKSMQGRVNSDTWTHGSSEEREKWFMTGYNDHSLNACDTFHTSSLS